MRYKLVYMIFLLKIKVRFFIRVMWKFIPSFLKIHVWPHFFEYLQTNEMAILQSLPSDNSDMIFDKFTKKNPRILKSYRMWTLGD